RRRVPRHRGRVRAGTGLLRRRCLLAPAGRRADRSDGAARHRAQRDGRRDARARAAERLRGERALAPLLRRARGRPGVRARVAQNTAREVDGTVGCWLLAAGWLLVAGGWLVAGCWLLAGHGFENSASSIFVLCSTLVMTMADDCTAELART